MRDDCACTLVNGAFCRGETLELIVIVVFFFPLFKYYVVINANNYRANSSSWFPLPFDLQKKKIYVKYRKTCWEEEAAPFFIKQTRNIVILDQNETL